MSRSTDGILKSYQPVVKINLIDIKQQSKGIKKKGHKHSNDGSKQPLAIHKE